jgi:hypothetical protein
VPIPAIQDFSAQLGLSESIKNQLSGIRGFETIDRDLSVFSMSDPHFDSKWCLSE